MRARVVMLVAFLLLGILSMGGCASMPPAPSPRPYTYVVGPNDVLRIEVFGESELSREVTVTPDGFISFPMSGTIKVQDLTIADVATRVQAQLLKVINNPVVTVTLQVSRSPQVQIVGEVLRQGPVPYYSRLSMVEAVNLAGGVQWPFAKTEACRIVRGPLNNPELIKIDYDDILDASARDVYLEPGDIVVVPAKYVTRFDRYVRQLLSPFTAIVGGGGGGVVGTARVATVP